MKQKQILVIGGSYFIGRVFCLFASGTGNYELHVVNRGKYTLHLDHTTQYLCDRHDVQKLSKLFPGIHFDSVVDFCAYSPGDIQSVFSALAGKFDHYIYLSSCSVYAPSEKPHSETSSFRESDSLDPAEQYAYHKLVLEGELKGLCAQQEIPYTILRPSFVYGPYNYAPRESYYVQLICRGGIIPVPQDAPAKWQFVYVKDVAQGILACLESPNCHNQDYILSAPEVFTYSKFMEVLEETSSQPLLKDYVPLSQVYQQNIPLPFPLEQNELYEGSKISRQLGLCYTPFQEGFTKTYNAFYKVFTK